MIDRAATIEKFGYDPDELKPKSNKQVVAICDECGKAREIKKMSYRDLCRSCALKRRTVSEETRQKMSVVHQNISEETRQKMSVAQKGKTLSEEHKQKISIAAQNMSKETRQKISVASKGRTHSEETRQKMSVVHQNISEETRQKMSVAQKGKTLSEEHKQKISAAGKGRTHSEETRKKISISAQNMSEETRKKMSAAAQNMSEETRQKISASQQGISYDKWETFAKSNPYCPRFNESCRESNREKYGRKCFICGKPESENITSTDKIRKLSVHHVNRNKDQGCNGHDWALVPMCMRHHACAETPLWIARIVYLLNHVAIP